MWQNHEVFLASTRVRHTKGQASPAVAPRPILNNNPSISSLIQLRPLPCRITQIHRSTRPFEIFRYSWTQIATIGPESHVWN